MQFQTFPEACLGLSGKNALFPFCSAVPSECPKERFLPNMPATQLGASLVAQMAKNLLAMQETRVPPLGQEDPLGEGMATHSSILVWDHSTDTEARWATVHRVAKSWTRLHH